LGGRDWEEEDEVEEECEEERAGSEDAVLGCLTRISRTSSSSSSVEDDGGEGFCGGGGEDCGYDGCEGALALGE